ncbi:MAG: hypothetical protein EXQ96_04930 [Alphaproteobacteria bacterium]|nr:hypothetical protein [Alphaproteobacteria bacterium]
MKRLTAAALALALLTATGRAQTLEEALVAAYQTNPTLRAEQAALRAVDEDVAIAISGWRPTVEVEGSTGYRMTNNELASRLKAESDRQPSSVGIIITQPLYQGGRTVAEISRANNRILAQRARLSGTEQDVLSAAATSYLDVLRDQTVVELNKKNEEVLRRQMEATRDRFRVGEVTKTDVSQAEARLARAVADRIGAEGQVVTAKATFKRVIGLDPMRLAWPQPTKGLPTNEIEAQGVSDIENPDIQAAISDEETAGADIRVAESRLKPDLSLSAEAEYGRDVSEQIDQQDRVEVKATVRIPLYQAGAREAEVRQRKELKSQRRIQVLETRRRVREKVTRAWESLETARAQITSFAAQVRANEIALDGVRQEAAVGSRTTLDVLDAEQELFDSEVNLVRSQRNEVVAGFQLQAAIGRYTAVNLNLPVVTFDPRPHYEETRSKWWGTKVPQEE